ncbi:MAG TPA: hypothetical protein VIJ71_02185, partial [Mycobacteriales bacterium]
MRVPCEGREPGLKVLDDRQERGRPHSKIPHEVLNGRLEELVTEEDSVQKLPQLLGGRGRRCVGREPIALQQLDVRRVEWSGRVDYSRAVDAPGQTVGRYRGVGPRLRSVEILGPRHVATELSLRVLKVRREIELELDEDVVHEVVDPTASYEPFLR